VSKLAVALGACARPFMRRRRATVILLATLAIVSVQIGLFAAGGAATTPAPRARGLTHVGALRPHLAVARRFASRLHRVTVQGSYRNDTSRLLRLIRPVHRRAAAEREPNPNPLLGRHQHNAPDGALQTSAPTSKMPGLNFPSFEGIDFPGVSCFCFPPDTNGEVGLSQFVQIVNQGLAVYDKTDGSTLLAPEDIATLWSGFGGVCENDAEGDPVVIYDQLANRWIASQFAGFFTNGSVTDECIAVSRTSDATGSWYRYGFHLGSDFFDYPKLGLWPDAYYMSMNVFNAAGNTFLGPQPFAFDRAAMLKGLPATFITTGITPNDSSSYLPADLDGSTLPPNGAPEPFVEWPNNNVNGHYNVFRFQVDWGTPANSTFTLAGSPDAANFTPLCPGDPNCVPQLGTTSGLDALADRMMFRAAYRNFGTPVSPDESLVTNYTVQATGVAAPRWVELNHLATGTPTLVQESTYQPDNTWRWMGSIAEDHSHDMALGYSASSAAIHPQIRYAGRLVGDPANTLGQAEAHLFDGPGSQTNAQYFRWGDYSDMTVDPVDDCTFWYTQEYTAQPVAPDTVDWRTRVGNFTFPSCTGPTGPNVTISKTADASSVLEGNQIGFDVEMANVGPGDATGLTFSDSLPSGTDVSWSVDGSDSDAGWSVSGSAPTQILVYTPTTLSGGSATHVHVISSTTANSCGDYDNTASFIANGGLSGNDSASLSVTCITITKTADASTVTAGSQMGFTVTLDNLGSVDATGVVVTDDLPAGPGVNWSTSSPGWSVTGSPPNQQLVLNSTTLNPGDTPADVVSGTTSQSCNDYVNTASFTSDSQGSGEATDVASVIGCPLPVIFKVADDNLVAAGATIGFNVELLNFGDADVTGLTFTDPLPAGSGVNWTVDNTPGNSTPGWSISGAPPSQSLVYSGTSLLSGDDIYVHVISGTNTSSCGAYNNAAQFGSANAGSESASDSVSVLGCPPPALYHTLTVNKSGPGAGTVTSSPSGINCGPVCSMQFNNATPVSLTAAASSGSRFTGWSGDCSGTTTTCALTMSADHNVNATFAKRRKCHVPKVVGLRLSKARIRIAAAHCRVGKLTKKKSSRKKKGRVLAQSPKPGKTLPGGSKVNLTVGKGPGH
jgi:uncharacterized repeat protein (TIGR01451 family)